MVDLKTLQKTFIKDIQTRGQESLPLIADDERLKAKQRLQVYQNNYAFLLTDMLMGNFPAVCRTVSEKFFRYLAAEFIKNHPLPTAAAHFYHEDLPSFIQDFPPLAAYPFLPDLAQLEILLHTSYTTPKTQDDNHPFFYPDVCLLKSKYPVLDIWRLAKGQTEDDTIPSMEDNEQNILFFCDGYNIQMKTIPEDVFYFCHLLLNHASLDQAIDKAKTINPLFDLNVTKKIFLSNESIIKPNSFDHIIIKT